MVTHWHAYLEIERSNHADAVLGPLPHAHLHVKCHNVCELAKTHDKVRQYLNRFHEAAGVS